MAELIKKCVFVVGPTASGKSAWALRAAEKYRGSVVNIDSIQLYQDLLIGSAAPTAEDKKRAPHFLYSYVVAPQELTAADYLRDFYQLIESAPRFPLFIVGGTGFYIRALEKGMYDIIPVPAEFRQGIEAELAAENGAETLHRELLQKDPESKIHLNDHFRLVRAIEIIRYTGKIPTHLKQGATANKNELPFPSIKLGFDFEKAHYEKQVAARTRKMIGDGIIEETRNFYDAGMAEWAPLQSVGYKETIEYLTTGKSVNWLFENINQSTMQLIKKQKTWFRRDKAILWSNHEEELQQFLS